LSFRPSIAVTLVVLPALAILIALGVWQFERLQWKEALIARIAERAADAPMPLDDAIALATKMPEAQRDEIEFRRVRISGEVAPAAPVTFATPDADNVRRALVPVLADGAVVFLDVRSPDGQTPLGGARTYDGAGVLRFGKPANDYTPSNDPARDLWFWPDLAAASAARNLAAPAPFFLAVEQPGGPPNPAAAPVLTNNHLGYALTWFGLAIGLVGVYLVWHHKNGRLTFGKQAGGA
jgi:surfeit locus 1 family protein